MPLEEKTIVSLATATAQEVIAELGLQPHPEGGHFVETYRDRPPTGERGAVTAIYFLLKSGEVSRWHRVDAAEIWNWYAGAPPGFPSPSWKARRPRSICSAPTCWPAHVRRRLCRRTPGNPRAASATGRWSAARWRRPSSTKASNWRPRGGSRNLQVGSEGEPTDSPRSYSAPFAARSRR